MTVATLERTNGSQLPVSEFAPTPTGQSVSKVTKYGWKVQNAPGQFLWLNKRLLRIDHAYQRDDVSAGRIAEIRSDWCWLSCATLVVAQRPDGTYWVIDGQHRKIAADHRSDIQELPCLVFQSSEKGFEANGFLQLNTNRGPVRMIQKFKAMVGRGDKEAVAVQTAITDAGLKIGASDSPSHVGCVGALMKLFADEEGSKVLWPLILEMGPLQEKKIIDKVVVGMIYLNHVLSKDADDQLLTDLHNREKLVEAGTDKCAEAIRQAQLYYKRSGERIYAQGIVDLLNTKRRTRRIPAIVE